MKGALVFLAVFVVVFLVCTAVTSLPPGQAIYNALKLPVETTTYKVGGAIYGDVLIKAIFNAVVYGFIVWLIFTIVTYTLKQENSAERSAKRNRQRRRQRRQSKRINAAKHKNGGKAFCYAPRFFYFR